MVQKRNRYKTPPPFQKVAKRLGRNLRARTDNGETGIFKIKGRVVCGYQGGGGGSGGGGDLSGVKHEVRAKFKEQEGERRQHPANSSHPLSDYLALFLNPQGTIRIGGWGVKPSALPLLRCSAKPHLQPHGGIFSEKNLGLPDTKSFLHWPSNLHDRFNINKN